MEILEQAWVGLSRDQASFFAAHIAAAARTVNTGPSGMGILPMYSNRFTLARGYSEIPGTLWPDLSRTQLDATCMLLGNPSEYVQNGLSAFATIGGVAMDIKDTGGVHKQQGVLVEGLVFDGPAGVSGSVLFAGDGLSHGFAGLSYFNEGLQRARDFRAGSVANSLPNDGARLVGLESQTAASFFASITSLYRTVTVMGSPIEHRLPPAQSYTLARSLLEAAANTSLMSGEKSDRIVLARGPKQPINGTVFRVNNNDGRESIVAISQTGMIPDTIAMAVARQTKLSDPDEPSFVSVECYYFRADEVRLAVHYLPLEAYSLPGVASTINAGEVDDGAEQLSPTGIRNVEATMLTIYSSQINLQCDQASPAATETKETD